MRPFKFFFMASIGVILFFFLAKVALFAFFMAAIMSVVFFVMKRIKYFFRHLSWEDESYPRHRHGQRNRRVGIGFNNANSYFDQNWDAAFENAPMSRTIHVH